MNKDADLQEARDKIKAFRQKVLMYSLGVNPKTQEGWEELGDAMMSLGYFIRTYADKMHAAEEAKAK